MITKPKGCHDIYAEEAKKWQYVNSVIDALCERYNYKYIRTPIFESSELFHRGMGESTDVVTKETYDFKDRGDRLMTLRPEGTAGIVRSYIENKMYGNMPQPVKLYYNGTMYRYERPQSGRDRELTQFGVEAIGSNDPMLDAEVISIPVNLFKILGLKEIKVKINTLGDKESRENYKQVLKDYLKPHLDELCEDCKARFEKNPLRILDCKVDHNSEIIKNAPRTLDYLNEESKLHFENVKKYLGLMDIDYEVDTKLVRGLDYYNHTVFEIEAHVEGYGANNVLAAGGRYNGLVSMLGGPETPAVGFALGLGRVVMALDLEGIEVVEKNSIDAFVMYVSDAEKEYATTLVQELRMNGFKVDTDYTGRSLKSQFKQADNLNAKYLIILNDADLENDTVKVKNNKTKAEMEVGIDYLMYYLDEVLMDDSEESSCGCGNCSEHECDCGDDCNCDDDCNCGCCCESEDDEDCTCNNCHCHEE